MNGLACLALVTCALVVCTVHGKSVASDLQVQDEAIQEAVKAARMFKRRAPIISGECTEKPEELDPFTECNDYVMEHCDPQLAGFCSRDTNEVSLLQLADLMQHISGFSQHADDAIRENAEATESMSHIFNSTASYYDHIMLSQKFTGIMEDLHEKSLCAFVPVWSIVYRMDRFGVEGVGRCNAMEKTYVDITEDLQSAHDPCQKSAEVAYLLTESFKSDVRCLSEDVSMFHEFVVDAVDGLKDMSDDAQNGETVMKHTEMFAYVAGMFEGLGRIGRDASMMYCGISEVLQLTGDLAVCFCGNPQATKELNQEDRKLRELMDILKQM